MFVSFKYSQTISQSDFHVFISFCIHLFFPEDNEPPNLLPSLARWEDHELIYTHSQGSLTFVVLQ